MISEDSRFRSSLPRSERIPIVTLSKSMRSAAFGACIGGTCDTAAMAWGPRWMRAVWAREGVCECLEFMQRSSDQTWQFRPIGDVKPFRRPGCGERGLLPHGFEDHTLGTLAVPFAVEDALPRAQIELSSRDRHDDLMPDR